MAMFINPPAGRWVDSRTHARLLHKAEVSGSTAQAWLFLEAAHVVGQLHFKHHLQTHTRMFLLAWRTHDWNEATGQMLRLALVPFGHLSGRLPIGNPGRSTVSAFKPLPVRAELADLITRARDQ